MTAISPAGTSDDPIRIGTVQQIVGQNFGYALGQSKVTFEGGPSGDVVVPFAQMLTGSSDSRLLFIVPSIPGIAETGQTMTLRVSNGVADDSRLALVMPVVVPLTGDMFVTWRADVTPNPNPNPITIGQEARFAIQLETGINLPATFSLSADIQDATVEVPTGLVDSIEFRTDPDDTVISNKKVNMGKSETRNIVVRIPQLPASFDAQTFTLKVTVSASGVVGIFSRSFTVGTAVPETDPNIHAGQTGWLLLDADGNPDSDPSDGKVEGAAISVKANLQMIVMFNLTLDQTASYDLTIKAKEGTTLTGWSPKLVSTPATLIGPVADTLVQFSVSPSDTATTNGIVVFRIHEQEAALDWFQEFSVELLSP